MMYKNAIQYFVFSFCLIFIGISITTQAQDAESGKEELNYGDNPDLTSEKYAVMSDNLMIKNYEAALEPAEWLLENAPKMSSSLYIKAIELYEGLEAKAAEEGRTDKQAQYQDLTLEMFRRRIELNYYKDLADIYERVGNRAYPYWLKREDKFDTLLTIYTKTHELLGLELPLNQLIFFYDLSGRAYRKKKITLDEFVNRYDALNEIVDHKIAEAESLGTEQGEEVKAAWIKYGREQLDRFLEGYAKDAINCDFVRDNYGTRFKENPKDLALAKRIYNYMNIGGCKEDPLFLASLETIYESEPKFKIAEAIAKLHRIKGNDNKALEWYEKAAEIAENKEERGELYFTIAKNYSRAGKLSDARTYANKAISANGALASEAYTFIGDLYLKSYESCNGGGGDPIAKKVAFFAAYDMYAKANNQAKMATAKQYFPTAAEIFTIPDRKEGETIEVGCWIGGTTTVRSRPSE
ncbi:MAG: tetratricopeptide repeat protein [Bernardetiaceae bacterium]|nr:tetratricopeptide repeat protein [Bernardetiaceae bacterium]